MTTEDLKSMTVEEMSLDDLLSNFGPFKTIDELARRLEKAQQQIVAQGLAENLLKRLIGRIMENADVSLPDATDIELQLVRQLSTVAEAKAEALEEAVSIVRKRGLRIGGAIDPEGTAVELRAMAAEYRAKAGRKE